MIFFFKVLLGVFRFFKIFVFKFCFMIWFKFSVFNIVLINALMLLLCEMEILKFFGMLKEENV